MIGVLSLIIWALLIVVVIKYVGFMLFANDHGEGGVFAIYSVLSRGLQRHVPDQDLFDTYHAPFKVLVALGVSAILSDGILTPSISVLGALEGLQETAGLSNDWVVGLRGKFRDRSSLQNSTIL